MGQTQRERTIDEVIKDKFGNVNSLYESKPFSVSKQHLYRVISGQVSTNLTIASEVSDALDLDLVVVHNLLSKARKEFKEKATQDAVQ